ncbi:truncated TonB-like membrane protein encoded within prophage [Escherichia coli]|nr:truncated TonB-like membrane protein encoded within prophage [Escherichia coli]
MKRRLLLLFLLSVLAVDARSKKADEPRQLVTVYPRYPNMQQIISRGWLRLSSILVLMGL